MCFCTRNHWTKIPVKRLNKNIEKQYKVSYLDFKELIANCKFIVLLLPLTKKSKHLFTKRIFQKGLPYNCIVFKNLKIGLLICEDMWTKDIAKRLLKQKATLKFCMEVQSIAVIYLSFPQ